MVRRGWSVLAAAPDIDARTHAQLTLLGAKAKSMPMARTGMNPLADLVYRRSLIALLRDERPDVLLAYTIKPVIWGLLAARAAAVPRAVALITGLGYAFTDGTSGGLKRVIAGVMASSLYRLALAAARIYVLPSYREGTRRSVLEAMAMGSPVITTDAPGCRETVVEGVNGLKVPPQDVTALEAAMEHLILHPEQAVAMGHASLERVRARYDVHRVNAQILSAVSS